MPVMSRAADELVVLIRNLPCSIVVLVGKFVKLMRKGRRSPGPTEDGCWLEGRANRKKDGKVVLSLLITLRSGIGLVGQQLWLSEMRNCRDVSRC